MPANKKRDNPYTFIYSLNNDLFINVGKPSLGVFVNNKGKL